MEVSGHLYAPAALESGKEPQVPNGQVAGWAVVLSQISYSCRESILGVVTRRYTD